MFRSKHAVITKILAVIILMTLITSPIANASETNSTVRASNYLDSYNAYLYRNSFGRIQVWFDVTGVDYMDEIGALTIKIYESTDNTTWTRVYTYKHDSTSGMLGFNKIYHSGHVEYQGTIGRYYKAYVTIWAGENNNGDTRYYWTDVQKATLLPG